MEGGEEPVFHHREPCKFPPPTRRRFSLIADRSSCWVINVQHRQREEEGGGYVREDEEKTIQEWKRQLGVKIERGEREEMHETARFSEPGGIDL